MATDLALARGFDETPQVVMSLPAHEAFMVASMIQNQRLHAPLLLRLMRAKYGSAEEVVYAPEHQKVLKREIAEFLTSLSGRSDSEVLGQNTLATVTVGSLTDFLGKLLAVVNEGISEKKGLFAITD